MLKISNAKNKLDKLLIVKCEVNIYLDISKVKVASMNLFDF